MNTIREVFGELLSFPSSMPDLILAEARSKLQDTFIIINKRLFYLSKVNSDYIEVYKTMDGDAIAIGPREIESMELWLPESGVYFINGRYEYLQKLAKRQWKKSFSWDYYSLTNIHSTEAAFYLYGQTPITMYPKDGGLWYLNLKIAEMREHEVTEILYPEFTHEINEFLVTGRPQ